MDESRGKEMGGQRYDVLTQVASAARYKRETGTAKCRALITRINEVAPHSGALLYIMVTVYCTWCVVRMIVTAQTLITLITDNLYKARWVDVEAPSSYVVRAHSDGKLAKVIVGGGGKTIS